MAEMTKTEARLLERHTWWKAAIADAETALKEDQWPRADTGYSRMPNAETCRRHLSGRKEQLERIEAKLAKRGYEFGDDHTPKFVGRPETPKQQGKKPEPAKKAEEPKEEGTPKERRARRQQTAAPKTIERKAEAELKA